MTKKRYVSLRLRVVRNLFILTAMTALTVAVVRFPAWKQDRYIRASMRVHGLSGETPVLWKGDPTGKQKELNLWENTAWTLRGYGSLKDSRYTLTLWDGDGAVIVEATGILESIWEI